MARVKIDLDRGLGRIDRNIYGNFAEHLGRCIYGGIYEEGSPLSDEHGFRQDVMEAVKGLNIPVLRWPGGNFASGYHWMDGIGPKDQRPRRAELAWHAEESNRFGTDEFIEYCRAIGTEPYICINLGTGTLDEAAAWVEYCNGTGDTYYANLRRANGHPEPYGVKYWGLGNEMFGTFWQIGHKEAREYALFAREVAKLMKRVDPSISLVSCGWDGLHDWDRIVLEMLAPYVDYHSIHIYTGSDDHYLNIAQVHHAERCIQAAWALIQEVRVKQRLAHDIRIAYDEWNVHRERTEGLEDRYNLSDALAVASYLNIFQRNPEKVGMANLAQLVNVIAPIFTSPEDLFCQAIYWPLQLYATHAGPISLDAWVESKTFTAQTDPQDRRFLAALMPLPYVDVSAIVEWVRVQDRRFLAPLMPLPYLDVSATCDQAGQEVTLFVVNRHADDDIEATIQFTDFAPVPTAQVYEVNGADLKTANDFGSEWVRVVQREVADAASTFSYTFPAHSVTVMALRE